MKKSSALFSVLLCIILLMPNALCFEKVEQWAAEGTFASEIAANGLSANMTMSGSSAPKARKGGLETWTLTGSNWYYHTMYVNIAPGRVSGAGGKHVYVEIDYFDESQDGWFYLKYNSRDKRETVTRKHKMTATQEWKTASFILEAPTLADDLNGGDFGISTLEDNDYSHSPVYIRGIRVRQLEEIKAADITIDIGNAGHIFFSDEEVKLNINLKNKMTKDFTADIKLLLQDTEGQNVYEQIESIDVKSMSAASKEVVLNIKQFGVYTLFAEGVNEELGYRFSTCEPLSYIKKSEFLSDRFGVCNHLAWGQKDRDPEIIYSLMKKAGIGWSRDEIKWENVERVKGEFKLQPYHERFIDLAADYGIKHMLIYYAGNALYSPTNNSVPVSDEELEAYGRYVYFLTDALKGKVNDFEYWNEYDHASQKTPGADFQHYVKLAKVTYENMKKANPDANALGFTAAGTGVAIIKTTFDLGGYEYMDNISYHLYASGSPDEVNVGDDTLSIRELINKYPGGKDMKIWLTEMGWTNGKSGSFAGFYNKRETAKFLPKEFVIQMEDGYLEKMFWYDMVDDQADPVYSEASFGMLENYSPAQRKVPFAAKPVFAAAAAMNGVLGTPDYEAKMMMNDDKVYAYHFKRHEDGKDTAVVWGTEKNNYVTLKLGTNEAKFYDIFGNEIIVTPDNGEYSFVVKDEPVYVVGDFESFEEGTPKVFISETIIKAAKEDNIAIKMFKTTDKLLNIEVSAKDDSEIKVIKSTGFENRTAQVDLSVKGNVGYSEPVFLKVSDNEGRIYYDGEIVIEYVDGLEISGRTRLYQDENMRRWRMELDIVSNFHGTALDGKLEIHEPAAFSKNVINLGKLKPKDNKVLFHLPEVPEFTSYWLKATIKLENGYEQYFEMPIDFALAFRAETAPVIDGELSEGEWKSNGRITSSREDQVYLLKQDPPWKGEKDLSAETYIMWDDDYLYLACKVTDDVFSCDYTGSHIWQGDSVQFGIAYNRENEESASKTFTEIGMALTPEGAKAVKYGAESGTSMDIDDSIVEIKRKGDSTVYEIRMPWSEAVPEGAQIKANTEIGFSMLVNDNDGAGRRGWIEFGSGIGLYKAVSEFARIRLTP